MKRAKSIFVENLEIGAGMPKICVPVTGRNKIQILEQVKKIKETHPDLVEWRADFYESILDPDGLEKILMAIKDILGQIPLLFTFRSQEEGGSRPISTEDYVNLIQKVSEFGNVQIIDVEVRRDAQAMNRLIGVIHSNGKTVLGSHHRFDRTPSRSDMIKILKSLELSGADIVKMAVMPHSMGDVNNLRQTTNEATCDYLNRPVVTMSMGKIGEVSRVAGEVFGSCITFGCVGEVSAPGQIPIEQLRQQLLGIHKIVEKI